jgi:response regulator RpfG family c-di-GMP phosphodiesterase
MHPTGNPKLLEWLVQHGLMSTEQQDQARSQQQLMGGRIEEAVLDTGALDEPSLLKFLANTYRTRFVSSEKLAKAHIDQATLELVPKKLAEQLTAFPVMYEPSTSTLSVVLADPDDTNVIREVQMASRVKHVKAFVGRPLGVKAAIAKHYGGDVHAFARLDRGAHRELTDMMDVFERNLVTEESMTGANMAEEAARERKATAARVQDAAAGGGPREEPEPAYLDTLEVLVTLLESTRSDLRGHSAHVSRLVGQIAERIGVSATQLSAFRIASQLHDLGKMGAQHLTALNVGVSTTQRGRAEQTYTAPCRLMETVKLPQDTLETLEFMYERFDGAGIPGQRSGKEIPLGARLLAIADTYADLTRNPKNPFGKTLDPIEACSVLERYAPSIFDPNLVELFKHAVTGDDLKARLLANHHRALIVDVDPEETTVLELRMIEQGFEVRLARSVESASRELAEGQIDIVVSEIDLGARDGFGLLEEAREQTWGKQLPWVIMTKRTSRQDADRAFQLGADDYVTKPVSADLLVTKLKQIIERRGRSGALRGVSGSLQEMSLPDIVQVLWHGRKSGSLKLAGPQGSGEIHFVEGHIYNALFGKRRGSDAFYAMVALQTGEFALDPSFIAPQRLMDESPEGLLLEGMRRLDEGKVG